MISKLKHDWWLINPHEGGTPDSRIHYWVYTSGVTTSKEIFFVIDAVEMDAQIRNSVEKHPIDAQLLRSFSSKLHKLTVSLDEA